jgi:nitroreductase
VNLSNGFSTLESPGFFPYLPCGEEIMSTKPQDNTAVIFGRRSIRVYSPGSITEAQVRQMLEAAMAAPSAMTKDPWRFIVIENSETLNQLTKFLPGGGMLSTAAAAIAVCGDLDATFNRSESYMLQDCSAAIENLLICAHGLGLGGCWVGVHPDDKAIQGLKQLLGLPIPVVPIAVISLGLPGEEPGPRTRYNAEYVHREKWQTK